MCNILKTADRRAKRMKSWNSECPMNNMCRVLFISDSMCLVWGSFGALCKIPDVNTLKATNPEIFIEYQPNFMENMVIRGEYRVIHGFGDMPNLKFLFTQDHMGLEISKRHSSYSLYPMSTPRLYDHIAYHGGIQTLTSWQSGKFLRHFEF